MDKLNAVLILLLLVGTLLFMVGANYYNDLAGWTGIALWIAVLGYLFGKWIYKHL